MTSRRPPPRRRYLSDRDIARIQALALSVSETFQPEILEDLDAPIRVGACLPGGEHHTGAQVVIPWRGRMILGWRLSAGARERRRRARRYGGRAD